MKFLGYSFFIVTILFAEHKRETSEHFSFLIALGIYIMIFASITLIETSIIYKERNKHK